MVGDVIAGCIGNQWEGLIRNSSDRSGEYIVDIGFRHRLRNNTATRQETAAIYAQNRTDAILSARQRVQVMHMANNVTVTGVGQVVTGRWVIVDYDCPPAIPGVPLP